MATQSPASAPWQTDQRPDEQQEEDGRAERLANWLMVYLAAFLTSLAVGGSAWVLTLAR
jgi:hypothetical protein